MTDPRVSLGPDVVGTDGEAVLQALDTVRPVVRVAAGLPPAAARAATALALMLSRVFPHTTIDGDADLGANPWDATTVSDALGKSGGAVPTPVTTATVDVILAVGAAGPADIYIGGDDWTAALSKTPVPVTANESGLGLHAAAALAASDVAKRALRPLGLVAVTGDEVIWNLLTHELKAAPDLERRRRVPRRVALLGCGSVGSSSAAVLACIDELTGEIWLVDPDTIDPARNPFRYPALTGRETGEKATWLQQTLTNAGWKAHGHVGDVASWVVSQPAPGLYGTAISSVDSVDGRRDVADVLAQTTLSAGVAGLALHVQVEHPADDFACPYCQFLDVRSALEEAQMRAGLVGLPVERVVELAAGGGSLTDSDVAAAVAAGRVHAERAPELVGHRLDDLVRRAYAEATVPTANGSKPAAVSAPQVSWLAGVLLAAELDKGALGIPGLNRRVDLDLSGLPLGVTSARPRDASGRCLCAQPARRRWAQKLYG